MKVFITTEEWYPVYELDTTSYYEGRYMVEIPDELFEAYTKSKELFMETQHIIEKYYRKAYPDV